MLSYLIIPSLLADRPDERVAEVVGEELSEEDEVRVHVGVVGVLLAEFPPEETRHRDAQGARVGERGLVKVAAAEARYAVWKEQIFFPPFKSKDTKRCCFLDCRFVVFVWRIWHWRSLGIKLGCCTYLFQTAKVALELVKTKER